MTRTNLIARSLNDLGAAAWFGGSLMGASAVNRAPADLTDSSQRNVAASATWRRWWPLQAVAVGANVVGGVLLTVGNRERVVAQRGVASVSLLKAGVAVLAIGQTVYSGVLGKRIAAAGSVPITDGTTPSEATPDDVASAMRQQRFLQWSIPALTGLSIVLNAVQGEQQRPAQVARGVLGRLAPSS